MDDCVKQDAVNKNSSKSPSSEAKRSVKKSSLSKGARKTEEFKKAYRQFYDDVKISDREDW